MIRKLLTLICVSLFALISCTKETAPATDSSPPPVPSSLVVNLPINLNPYNLLTLSKSSSVTIRYSIPDSLFDWKNKKTRLFDSNKIEFTQVPLKTDTVFAGISKNKYQTSNQNTFPIKSYYIKRVNKIKSITTEFITTLIPAGHAYLSSDFLYKPQFTGAVLYSRLNGDFFKLENYKQGKITKGKIYTAQELSKQTLSVEYIALYNPKYKLHTKGDERKQCPFCGMEFDLPPIVVIPKEEETDPPPFSDNIDLEEENNHECGEGGGGGGSNSSTDNPHGNITEEEEEENGLQYTVLLMSNDSQKGRTSGSGTYEIESSVTIAAHPFWGHRFVYWNGNVPVPTQLGMSFIITKDIWGTANFDMLPQCKNFYGNKANPLGIMELQPSNGSPKHHNGVDLAGPEGAPIYAMFEGVIGAKYVIEQPNKTDRTYPLGYTGDKADAGNRIYIQSQIDGNNINVGYCHLMAGKPVAVSPRTGKIFAPGDEVLQGDVIGYIGVTGNASPEYPHLHLTIYENGVAINPISTPCN